MFQVRLHLPEADAEETLIEFSRALKIRHPQVDVVDASKSGKVGQRLPPLKR
jgi:hypothetical protein